jgi:hypothetical protein
VLRKTTRDGPQAS